MFDSLAKNTELITLLRNGGTAVIRTDTLYGIVARADSKASVEKVYAIKGRDAHKSCIVLLSDMSEAYGRSAEVDEDHHHLHGEFPTSFLVHSPTAPAWLLRANNDLAYRVPHVPALRQFLARTGPLVAPSANPQGMPPARTIDEARRYFGAAVDMYVDGGAVPADTPPSRLVRVHADGSIERLR